ncbi:hypothetical protein BI024_gp58 [Streptomyces phage Nanodon]|uniref:Uncharacterized protein n=1 Tax=Streptomyces phage Nanodon TaxID=1873777 RepID=A0A1B1PA76_9CAUD|nr:hypothetical protein BI024_gp58 [Streptomyces phage Nanodon]ANT41062.1 hypothetical protein SEA_NANODON_58 [Streptomyces phage Nanodon]
MRITPRAQEINAVVELLESDEFEDSKQAAKAIIKEVASILAMRDSFALAHIWQDGTAGLSYAPFGTEGDAKKFGERLGGVGGTAHVVKLVSPEALIANQDGKAGWTPFCLVDGCGHAPFTHSMAGTSRGACMVDGCECSTYRK